MDKSFFRCKEEKVCESDFDSKKGASLILYALLCISLAFTLMNATIKLYASEETHSKLSEAVVAFSEGILQDGAVFASSSADYEEKELH